MTQHGTAVVGRRHELDAVQQFVARLGATQAGLSISGPAGIGKTTVWQAGVESARAAGYRVLTARASDVEAGLSFAGLADLLAPVEPAFLERLPAPQRLALDVALLRAEAPGRSLDTRAVATATCSLLRELALAGPTLVAVDDAQWLDEATAAVLRFALRRLEDVPLGVLASVRVDGELPEAFDSALAAERRLELALMPLSVAAMHDVIRAQLGLPLPRPTLVKVVRLSGGNAFYAVEIARELVRLGRTTGHDVPVPAGVQALVRARVARLPRPTREALLTAAALAVPTTVLVDEEALAPAEQAALVSIESDGRIRFAHPLVAAAVYESASPTRRRRVHQELAGRLSDPEERARHLALAAHGRDDEVARALDGAAAHAAARGASTAAADLARLALELTERQDGEQAVRRSLALAHHLLDAGDTSAARDVLERCDAASVQGDLRAELLRELGSILWFERDFDDGYRLVLEALDHARDPEVAARTHRAAAWLSQEIDLPRAIAHDDAALALLDPDRHPGAYSWVLLHGAYLRLLDGRGADDDAYRRGRDLQARNDEWDDTSPVLGMWPLFEDDFSLAREFYEPGLARSRAEGDETSVQGTLLRLAEIACWTGDWETADRLAAEGVELADRIGSSAYLGSALYARALVDAHLGRVEDARAAGERIVDLFTANETQAALGHWVLGFLDLSLEQAADADEHLGRAAAIVEALGQREPARFRFHPDQIEAAIQLGDLDRAESLLDALDRRAAIFPRPWILAAGARCRALLLAARGDLEGSLAALQRAHEHHARLEMPFEQARTLLVEGRILRRLKLKRQARTALEQAGAIFERLGAELWATRTQHELQRTAVRRAPSDLSATELRIARLAAAGLSNPAIAAEAFVARKTVEANLARAYRKLGISSRAQLARALDERPPAIP